MVEDFSVEKVDLLNSNYPSDQPYIGTTLNVQTYTPGQELHNGTNFITLGRTQTEFRNFCDAYYDEHDESQKGKIQETGWGDKLSNPKYPSIEWTTDGRWYEKREGLPPSESALAWDEMLGMTDENQEKQECDSNDTFGEKVNSSQGVSNQITGHKDQLHTCTKADHAVDSMIAQPTIVTDINRYTYQPNIASPMTYRKFYDGPWTPDETELEGYYPKRQVIKLPKIPIIDWQKYLKKDQGIIANISKHVMEHRELSIDVDEYSMWAMSVLPNYGKLTYEEKHEYGVTYDEDWQPSEKQLRLEQALVKSAQDWFKAQELIYKLRNLSKKHRRYQQVHLYTRNRAPWPTLVMGPEPVTKDDIKTLRNWCIIDTIKNEKHIPRALSEYLDWWHVQRDRRTHEQVKLGDEIEHKGKSLAVKLNKIVKSNTLGQVKRFAQKEWTGESQADTLESNLEKDIWSDWRMKYLPIEF